MSDLSRTPRKVRQVAGFSINRKPVAVTSASATGDPRLSITLYIAAGWLMLIAVKPLWESVPAWGLFWLLAGGIAYTAGVLFYAALQFRYHHLVWHLCVVAGSGCHFVAVLRYAA